MTDQQITNPEVLQILAVVIDINDVRAQLLAHREEAGDLSTARSLLGCDIDIVRLLQHCLTLEENAILQAMLDRTVAMAETTCEMITLIELRNAVQQAEFEAARSTVH
jgi:hypothetical protein